MRHSEETRREEEVRLRNKEGPTYEEHKLVELLVNLCALEASDTYGRVRPEEMQNDSRKGTLRTHLRST